MAELAQAGDWVREARQLEVDKHFEIKLKERQCLLNEAGIERAEKLVGVDSFYSNPDYMEWPHLGQL